MRTGSRLVLSLWLGLAAVLAAPEPAATHDALDGQIAALSLRLVQHPDAAAVYLERGDLYRRQGDWARALADLARAAELDPQERRLERAAEELAQRLGRAPPLRRPLATETPKRRTEAAAAAGGTTEGPVSVTRGPYLQRATPTGLVVRWRTDIATDSRVLWGNAPGNLRDFTDDPALVTDHEVAVSGLLPATTYFYAVGTTSEVLTGGDASTFFVTPPLTGTAQPIRVWVIGDSGAANADARAVRDAYLAFSENRHTDLWLMLGDNAYFSGTDAEYQAAVFDTYPSLLRQTVLWPTLGNHDGISADSSTQTGPYYEIFTLPAFAEAGGLPSGTEAYYAFDYGNLHFIVLDSHETDRSTGGAMMSWMAADVAATTADWVIAFWHHPPYSRGSHDSDAEIQLIEMRENALPILEGAGVDLVLAGHSHSYERSFLLDSHYGDSTTLTYANLLDDGDGRPAGDGAYRKQTPGPAPHEGAVYAVAGSSAMTAGGPLDHPAMFTSLDRLGSLVLDFDGPTLNAVFLDDVGSIADHFTVIKGFIFADGFESGDTEVWSSTTSP